MPAAALAFRGYNVTNLGRTRELLNVPAYAQIVREELARYGDICSGCTGRSVDLVRRVVEQAEPQLDAYAEAVALVVAVESAQLRLLGEIHGIDPRDARFSLGYSLGELHAVCLGGALRAEELVRLPLTLAADCAELASDCRLGVLFSRGPAIPEEAVLQLCADITASGEGTIGVSAILSPNTYLVIGQGDTIDRFKAVLTELSDHPIHLRINDHRWPPLHTPIVRQRHVTDRAGLMLEKLPLGRFPLQPDVLSLVTGKRSYAEHTTRDTLRQWVARPQRLWDAVCEILAADVRTVVHLGPEPNVIPATFRRIAENLQQEAHQGAWESLGIRTMTTFARRPWLAALLPSRASLLRAPFVVQVIAEDWLLDHRPG